MTKGDNMKKKPIVSIIMGSDSDMPVMKEASLTLKKFGIAHEIKILSAHRSPDKTADFAKTARKRGIKVIIAGAGGAAHLAGVVAAHTILPVIGVPMESKLEGMDSLLSTVQMPSGVPVATVSIGKTGAINAAILAAQIIATGNGSIEKKIEKHKKELVRKIEAKNKNL
jgi:phosphoribosylaminoimidazole carboxylase PurE protein